MQFYSRILKIYPEFSTIFGPKQTSVIGASRHVAVAGLCVIVMESVNQKITDTEKRVEQKFNKVFLLHYFFSIYG